MGVLLNESEKKPAVPISFCYVAEKKIMILEHLEEAVAKLREARREIRKVVRWTLEMKGDGDDIADQVLDSMVEAFANEDSSWILKDYIKDLE